MKNQLNDFLNELTNELYTDIIINSSKRVSTEEELKTSITLALYQAYKYGENQGWAVDLDSALDDRNSESFKEWIKYINERGKD